MFLGLCLTWKKQIVWHRCVSHFENVSSFFSLWPLLACNQIVWCCLEAEVDTLWVWSTNQQECQLFWSKNNFWQVVIRVNALHRIFCLNHHYHFFSHLLNCSHPKSDCMLLRATCSSSDVFFCCHEWVACPIPLICRWQVLGEKLSIGCHNKVSFLHLSSSVLSKPD